MDTTMITEILRSGVWVVIKLCAPMLLLSMAVGVLLTIFHEQTLSFIFKVTVVVLVLLIGGGWMMETLLDYARSIFELIGS